MKLITKGKTKDLYELDDGNYLLKFKDGDRKDGSLIRANKVGLTIEGAGKAALRLSIFFELLKDKGIPHPLYRIQYRRRNHESETGRGIWKWFRGHMSI